METLVAPPQLPDSIDELDEETILRIPATYDDYLDVVETTPYPVQFLDGEIIIMSQATDTHEQLVIRLGKLFAIYFDELDDYRVLGSNVKIVIPERKGDFNADLSVVYGPSDYGITRTGNATKVQLKNPYIVAEILSKGTRSFDLGGKLLACQVIPSLQHILLVDQQAVHVSVCSRTDQPDQWLLTHYHQLTDVIALGTFTLSIADIYRKIDLSA